jgi:sugar/nucleoside kinase (ribokinase family)
VKTPDFLAVGHLCCDIVDGRRILGGSASYASLTAKEFERDTGILADNFPFLGLLGGVTVKNIGSSSTTTFRNLYRNGVREQFISDRAREIGAADVPDRWTGAGIVYLCPIADEVVPDIVSRFAHSLIGAGAQGWFRKWDANGRVGRKTWESAIPVAEAVDVIVYSELDTDDPYGLAVELARHAPIVIVTRSSQGADVFADGSGIHVPAFEIEEVDPTGAGDVFAAAFLIHYEVTEDPVSSAKFACCAASFVCEQEGTLGIPTFEQVHERLRRYNRVYSESLL